MSHLDAEDLALIAIGETPTDAETRHLAECDECTLELAELERTVAVGRSTATLGTLETPPERVWDRILEDVRSQPAVGVPAAPADAAEAAGSAANAPSGDGRAGERRTRRSRLTRTLLTLAAGVAVVLTLVGTWVVLRPPESLQIASAELAAFPDHPGAVGEATVTEDRDGERTVTVRLDASESEDGFREVWLITSDASALVSLGELDGSEGTFVVPAGVDLKDYVLVDVSQEPRDDDPAHSGDSIVRGELEFT
jgi:hypothetical protein